VIELFKAVLPPQQHGRLARAPHLKGGCAKDPPRLGLSGVHAQPLLDRRLTARLKEFSGCLRQRKCVAEGGEKLKEGILIAYIAPLTPCRVIQREGEARLKQTQP
jgi:hypothetical protein